MTPLPIGRPRFVTLDEALAWHAVAVAQYGGSTGVRDVGLLESALSQPRQQFGGEFAHVYPFGMAAAYAYFVAKNHPFVDGNKRVALMCCGAFLRMNGWNLESEGEASADAVLDLVSGKLDRDGLAQWLREHCRPLSSLELRDFFAVLRSSHLAAHFQTSSGGRPGEIAQSAREAEFAIPLLRETIQSIFAMQREGADPRHIEHMKGYMTLLAAIYRLAEDMGYEW